MTDNWYDALSAARAGEDRPCEAAGEEPGPEINGSGGVVVVGNAAGELAHEPGLAALIKLQWVELQRLARENERLMDRLETLLQLHERELVLRQQLQAQIERLGQGAGAPGGESEREAIQRDIRDGVAVELKPILIAIVELLELALQRPQPAGQTGDPAPIEAIDPGEELKALPEILIRPLEELLKSAKVRARQASSEPLTESGPKARRDQEPGTRKRPKRDGRSGLGALSWTSVFS